MTQLVVVFTLLGCCDATQGPFMAWKHSITELHPTPIYLFLIQLFTYLARKQTKWNKMQDNIGQHESGMVECYNSPQDRKKSQNTALGGW